MTMTLFGMSIETIYLILLVVSVVLTILYLLFGDVLDGIGVATGFFHPVLILAFITFFSAGGYIMDKVPSLNSILIIVISAPIAAILDVLLTIFVILPMSSAE